MSEQFSRDRTAPSRVERAAVSGVPSTEPNPEVPVDVLMITTVSMSLGFVDGLVASLSQRGVTVGVVCSPDDRLTGFARKHALQSWGVPMSRRITPVRDLVTVFRLARVMRVARPTVVHAQTPKAGLLGIIAAALTDAPVRIYHMRGLPAATATGAKRRLLELCERCSCFLAHKVICVSRSLRNAVVAEGLCSPEKITVPVYGSGQGVDATTRFNPFNVSSEAASRLKAELGIPESAPVIGFVGRLVRDKGIVELAEAWRTVKLAVPGTHLILIGPEEIEDPVPMDVMQSLRGDPRVHLLGERSDTPSCYAIMDVGVLPSHREGFPNVPLEAAAMERPMVTSDCMGCVDAVEDGVTGTVVARGNSTALAAALIRYLRDDELRLNHGKAGRRRALTRFEPERIFSATFDVYEEVLRSKGATLKAARRRNVSED